MFPCVLVIPDMDFWARPIRSLSANPGTSSLHGRARVRPYGWCSRMLFVTSAALGRSFRSSRNIGLMHTVNIRGLILPGVVENQSSNRSTTRRYCLHPQSSSLKPLWPLIKSWRPSISNPMSTVSISTNTNPSENTSVRDPCRWRLPS